jgi:DNA-binding GntR family transcriptional regulator
MSPHLIALDVAPDLVDRVHRALRDAICDGDLEPGARLTQESLAERLGVSRQPVLQALRLLRAEGFVHDAPARGVVVASIDAAAVEQVCQLRGALEGLAARLAAQRRARLDHALLAAGRAAVAAGDLRAMVDADLAFHGAIALASGNPLLARTATQHAHHVRRVMSAVLRHDDPPAVWDDHEAIADAIAAGQADRVSTLVATHHERAGRDLAGILTQLPTISRGEPA